MCGNRFFQLHTYCLHLSRIRVRIKSERLTLRTLQADQDARVFFSSLFCSKNICTIALNLGVSH